jgi:hypothetical protein
MTAEPDADAGVPNGDGTWWKLPDYIWLDPARWAWLEAAERSWSERCGEDFERGRLRRIPLKLPPIPAGHRPPRSEPPVR